MPAGTRQFESVNKEAAITSGSFLQGNQEWRWMDGKPVSMKMWGGAFLMPKFSGNSYFTVDNGVFLINFQCKKAE